MSETLRDRLERGITATIGILPPPVLRLLNGGKTTRVDGLELAPDVQLGLTLLRLSGHRGLDTMSPPRARAEIRKAAKSFAGRLMPVARIEPRTLPGPAGDIPARLYVPSTDGRRRGLLVYYHGGGWVVGDLDTHDPVCRFLAHEADAPVLSIDYRLAPEHRFPAAVEDALAAYRGAVAEAASLRVDPARIAVGGDSAGGNLAAVVSQLALRERGLPPVLQLLIYPVTDLTRKTESYRLFADGFFLTEKEMDWYRGHYLPNDEAARDPRASPFLGEFFRGLPPAMVLTAGFDVLRDEGEAYAGLLESHGVKVLLRRFPGLIHGFANSTGISPGARAAMGEAAAWLRATLGPAI